MGSAESFPTFLPFKKKKRGSREVTDKEVRCLEYSQEQYCRMPQKWNGWHVGCTKCDEAGHTVHNR
jgi:hypothetical protein